MTFSLNYSSNYSEEAIEKPSFTARSMITLTMYCLTFILGLPGNAMVIWVAGLKMKRTVNTVWFLNLAVADFLCCLSLPLSIAQIALDGHWYYGGFLCKVIPSAIIFNMFASVFILVAISMDRCLLVIKPVWSQNHRTVNLASLLCVGIWLLAFLMCVPVFLYRETLTFNDGKVICIYNYGSDSDYFLYDCYKDEDYFPEGPNTTDEVMLTIMTTEHTATISVGINNPNMFDNLTAIPNGTPETNSALYMSNKITITTDLPSTIDIDKTSIGPMSSDDRGTYTEVPLIATTYTRMIFGFVIPLAVILTCYACILCRVRRTHFSKSKQKMQRLILIIVSTFFICWAPYHIIGVFLLYSHSPTLALFDHLSQCLAYVNSCINPILYVFTGQDFKRRVRKSLHGILESAFSDDITRSTAATKSRNSSDKYWSKSSQV